jgi:cation transporter-like permease
MQKESMDGRGGARGMSVSEGVGSELVTLVGAVILLVMLTIGVSAILLQSFLAWCSLPSLSGIGSILYGFVAVALITVSVFMVWAYRRWRDPSAD